MMKLNDFAGEIVSPNYFVKASFGGFAGGGKTRTATEFITGVYKELGYKKPILIIDNEKGSRFLVGIFAKAGIKTLLKDTIELADVLAAFDYLNNGEIDLLFIDSLTKVWYKYVKDYKKKNNKIFMTLQDWGKILPSWQEEFSDKFVNLNGSCIFTGRGGYTYEMEENEETHKKEFVKSGVKMKMAGETPFEPDLNIWMEIQQEIGKDGKPNIWREALILKDRSGLIDGKSFKNPTYEDFKPVIQFLVNVPKGEVKKESNIKNLAPAEDKAYYERKELKQIELDKISALFIENKFGTSNEDKRIKVAITKKFFDTTSNTEIENMRCEELKLIRLQLEKFFEGWIEVENKDIYINTYKLPNTLNLE